jgi:membrane-associated phospholipid phosphatase
VRAIGHLGDQPPMLALSAAVLAVGWWRDDRRAIRAGARMLLAEVASIVLKDQVKRAVTRTRPHVLIEDGEYELRTGGPHEGKYNSFPSGHTAGAVAVARAFAREYPEAAVPAYAFAAVVAAGQVPESAHYPTDVSAGVAVGFASEAIANWLFDAVESRLEGPPHRAAPRARREMGALEVEPVEQP